MTVGFIMLRHVNNHATDLYWKQCYRSIRKWYPDVPIMIVDDNSHRDFLHEDLIMTRCTVIYDYGHGGRAELLPYYYFHRMKPFDTAVVVHDSIILQSHLRELDDVQAYVPDCKWLWSIPHTFDYTIAREMDELLEGFPEEVALNGLRLRAEEWDGVFGVMSIMQWTFLDQLQSRYQLFDHWLPKLKNREYRCALERVFGLLCDHHRGTKKTACYGNIMDYIRWGVSFIDYLYDGQYRDAGRYPLMKIWSGR